MAHASKTLLQELRGWLAQVDRERLTQFSRFLLRRFVDDRCFESAGALAYTTLFALVPFSAVLFAVLSAFPNFHDWANRLSEFVFSNFVPASARGVEVYLRQHAQDARDLTASGVVALVASVLVTMWSIEQTFNRIWRVPSTRPKVTRILLYWTLLTLGSLLVVAGLTATSALFSIPALAGVQPNGFGEQMLRYLPHALELVAFTAAFWFIPHRTIPLRFAFFGGLFTTFAFEWLKAGLAIYLRNASYEALYGVLAVIPIFLIWVYMSWLVVLLGASLAASLASFRYQPKSMRLTPGAELYAVMRVLGRFEEARAQGTGLHLGEIRQREPGLTDELLQVIVSSLCKMRIVARAESGAWLLSRDLDAVLLGEVYEGMHLRVPPPEVELCLPSRHDAVGRAAQSALEQVREHLKPPLERTIASFLAPDPEGSNNK